MQPIVNEQTEIIVPVHLPNINPETRAIGDAKPNSKIQITLKIKKPTKSSILLLDLKLLIISLLLLMKVMSVNSLMLNLEKMRYIKIEKQIV